VLWPVFLWPTRLRRNKIILRNLKSRAKWLQPRYANFIVDVQSDKPSLCPWLADRFRVRDICNIDLQENRTSKEMITDLIVWCRKLVVHFASYPRAVRPATICKQDRQENTTHLLKLAFLLASLSLLFLFPYSLSLAQSDPHPLNHTHKLTHKLTHTNSLNHSLTSSVAPASLSPYLPHPPSPSLTLPLGASPSLSPSLSETASVSLLSL
jgi:hypothetical protein